MLTVGCLPLTDEFIEEVYLLAIDAKSNGQSQIPVHIFPTRLYARNYENLIKENSKDKSMINFWTNLKEGFDYFENKRQLCPITVNKNGQYLFRKSST